jgi:glycosyltransferase involved in cell wall biosynthesis
MATANDHRWVVAFAGARDSYQVPVALHESGLLQRLVTDFYAPLDRPLPAAVAEVLPSLVRSKLRRRFDPGLPSRLVEEGDRFLPEFEGQIRNELDWPQEVFDTFSLEPHLADLCIVASKYTRKTLIENGVNSERISVVPYGIDLESSVLRMRMQATFRCSLSVSYAAKKACTICLKRGVA